MKNLKIAHKSEPLGINVFFENFSVEETLISHFKYKQVWLI